MNPKHPPGPSMTLGNHARAGRASPHCLTSSVDATSRSRTTTSRSRDGAARLHCLASSDDRPARCAARQRPAASGHAADQRDELAPLHFKGKGRMETYFLMV